MGEFKYIFNLCFFLWLFKLIIPCFVYQSKECLEKA